MTEMIVSDAQQVDIHPFDAGRQRASEVAADLILSAVNDYAEIWRHMVLPDFVTLMRYEGKAIQVTEVALEVILQYAVMATHDAVGAAHPEDRFGWQDGFELELTTLQYRLERLSQSPEKIIQELAENQYDLSEDSFGEIARLAVQSCLNWFGSCLDLMMRGVPCVKLKIQPIDQGAPILKPRLVFDSSLRQEEQPNPDFLFEAQNKGQRNFKIVDEDGKLRPAIGSV